MILGNDFYNIPLPHTFKRNRVDCFLDPYRKKLIPITSEEKVRQRIAAWFEKEKLVPSDRIILEQHLSHYGLSSKDRADIVIEHQIEENVITPLAIIECKAESVSLVDSIVEQAKRYADAIKSKFFIITNGIEIIAAQYNLEADRYEALESIPTYLEMEQGNCQLLDLPETLPRVTFEKLDDPEVRMDYLEGGFFGEDTPLEYTPLLVNLLECLMDTSRLMKPGDKGSFELVEDYGIRLLTYGNAAGGIFSGPYRSYIIKTKDGNHQFISFGISTYVLLIQNGSKSKTALSVAVDDFDKSHHSLQYVFENIELQQDTYSFWHSGRIAVGNKGSGKISELKELIAKKEPSLLKNGNIFLGRIRNNCLFYMDDPQIEEFFCNLIRYCLIRDEYREIVKRVS